MILALSGSVIAAIISGAALVVLLVIRAKSKH